MLVGGAAISVLAKKLAPVHMLALALFVSAAGSIGVGFSTQVPITIVLQFFMVMIFPMVHVSINMIMLRWAETAFIGRVSGIMGPMFMGMMVLMMALAGPIKTVMPLTAIYTLSGIFMLAGALSLVPLFKQQAPETQAPAVSA